MTVSPTLTHRAKADSNLTDSYMLASAARATSTRGIASRKRSFASVVDAAGFKVAAVDNGQPTSSVTFLVKAGSRYESKPGVAHVLKNFGFKVRLLIIRKPS
jgi:Insulinase (Peptidase family M16)